MRYIIDAVNNGYILTIKRSTQGEFVAKKVFPDLQGVFNEIDIGEGICTREEAEGI